MDETALFDEICALLTAVGVEIRVERFSTPPDSAGGLCRVAGKNLVLLHSGSSKAERGRALLEPQLLHDLEQCPTALSFAPFGFEQS